MEKGTRLFAATVIAPDVERAADLDAVHERAVAQGSEVVVAPGHNDAGAPPGWRDCTLRDPMGNVVRVVSSS